MQMPNLLPIEESRPADNIGAMSSLRERVEGLVASWLATSKLECLSEYESGASYQAGVCSDELAAALAAEGQGKLSVPKVEQLRNAAVAAEFPDDVSAINWFRDQILAALAAADACTCADSSNEHGCPQHGPFYLNPAAAPSLHKEEVNMPRDPRDKQGAGEHRADSEQTSAFDAMAWLAKEYPDWTADVKPYEIELIERAYHSGLAALHKEGAGGELSIESFTQGVLFAANFLEREADANFMPNEPAKVLLKGMASALRINMKASGFAAASPAGRGEQEPK